MATTFRELLDDFYPYAKKKLGFDKDAKIHFASDPSNGNMMLGKTAHYDPSDYTVTIYTDNRHPKDIMRSVSHELVHHAQNCRGDLSNMSEDAGQPGYAQNDSHMREMEREAYEKGNMCFRDWEDGLKAKLEPGTIYESKLHRTEGKNTIMSQRDLKNEALNKRLMENWGYKVPVEEKSDPAKQAWMQKFQQAAGNPQPIPQDFWDTATYLHSKGEDPVAAGEKYKTRTDPNYEEPEDPMDDFNYVGHRAHYEESKTQTEALEGWQDVPDWLNRLVQHEADSLEAELGKEADADAIANEEVAQVYDKYVIDLEKALTALVGEEMAGDMMSDGNAPYAVLMGLNGSGVGIWDGRWDHYEDQQEATTGQPWTLDGLEGKLKQALGGYIDDTGGGSLNSAIQNAAYETSGLDLAEIIRRKTKKAIAEYGDHETRAAGGLVNSYKSSDPEMDFIEDLALTIIEDGGSLMQIATALKAEEFDAFVMAGALVVGSEYILAKPDAIETGPDEEVREVGPYILGYQEKETRGEKAAQPSGEDQGAYDMHYTEGAEKAGDVYTTTIGDVTAKSQTMHGLLDQIENYYHSKTGEDNLEVQIGDDDVYIGNAHFKIAKNGEDLGDDLYNELEREDISKGQGPYQHKTQGGDGVPYAEGFRDSPEEKEMTSKMSNKEFSDYHTRDKHVVPNLKGDMGPMPGMEGPFQFKSGAVLYYDPKAGKYYDRGKDMYIDNEEAAQLTMEKKEMTLREKVEKIVKSKLAEYGGYDDDPYADEDPYMAGLEAEFPWLQDKKKKKGRKAMGDEDAAMAAAMADAEASGEFDVPPEEEGEMSDEERRAMYDDESLSDSDALYQENADAFAAGDKVQDDRNGSVGTVVEPMVGGAVVELEDGTIVKLRDKFMSKAQGEDPTMMKEEGAFDVSQIQSEPDPEYGGMIHTIPGVQFTGDIAADLQSFPKELLNWIYGEMETGDDIMDSSGAGYAGSDVQDHVQDLPDEMFEQRELIRRVVERVLAEADGLSDKQKELDLDDDGKIEPEDLAGLRSGKEDEDVGEEAEEKKDAKTEGKLPPALAKYQKGQGEASSDDDDDPELEADSDADDEKNESIAKSPEDFYNKVRNESRTLSESWNKDAKSNRASMLNNRLMEAWFPKK